MFKVDSKLFLHTIAKFVNVKANLNNVDTSKKINNKSKFYVNYKLRSLNIFLTSNSINDYYPLNIKLFKVITKSIKTIFGTFVPSEFDTKLRKKQMEYIKEWSKNRYEESNILTKELINSNSNDFDLNKYFKEYE